MSNVSSIVGNDIELIKRAKKKLVEASQAAICDNWTLFSEESRIKVYTEDTQKNGCSSICGNGIVNATPRQILDYVCDQRNWKKMDNMLEDGECINLSKDQRVIHLMFHGVFGLVSKRDVVFLETISKNTDSIMIISTPTNLESDFYPTTDSHIRTDLIGGGWYIRPVDKGRSLVTYYNNVDLKMEYVFPQIMNMFMSKIPTVMHKVERESERFALSSLRSHPAQGL